jgi:hypothetical protein
VRVLVVALAICCAAVAARAQQDTDWDMGGQVRMTKPPSQGPAPGGVKKLAEDAVRAQLPDPANLAFSEVGTQVVTSVRRSAFEDRIPGPLSIVCGQYAAKDPQGGQAHQGWFFVPVKHSQVLWAEVDPPELGAGNAYLSCKNAGLAN